MLAEASIARLAEMGIDAFVLRASPQTHASVTATPPDINRLIALIGVESLSSILHADIERALRMSGCRSITGFAPNEDALEDVAAVIAFDSERANALRSTLSDTDAGPCRWLVVSNVNNPALDAAARREFWGALKKLIG
ncbi:MAG: hypothetical protein ABI451_06905 [Dokdonella sp.]